APGLVSVVAVDPGQLCHAGRFDVEIEAAIAGPHCESHAAIIIAAQAAAAETRKPGSRRVQVTELLVIVIAALGRYSVRVVIPLHAGTQMEQEGGRQGSVVVDTESLTVNVLQADLRDRFGQAIHSV